MLVYITQRASVGLPKQMVHPDLIFSSTNIHAIKATLFNPVFRVCIASSVGCISFYMFLSIHVDITLIMQDIAGAKLRQRGLPKKMFKRKEITPKDLTNGSSLENMLDQPQEEFDQVLMDFKQEGLLTESEHEYHDIKEETEPNKAGKDVPDGAQISKTFDKLCNIVNEKVRCYQSQEPKIGLHTKGYIVIAEKGSYDDTCFHSLPIPSKGRVIVSDAEGNRSRDMKPIPELPRRPEHYKSDFEFHGMQEQCNKQDGLQKELTTPNTMSYEKVEMVESIEKFSDDKIQSYEETAMIMETITEKTSKKKLKDKNH